MIKRTIHSHLYNLPHTILLELLLCLLCHNKILRSQDLWKRSSMDFRGTSLMQKGANLDRKSTACQQHFNGCKVPEKQWWCYAMDFMNFMSNQGAVLNCGKLKSL